jgi:WD repeat-containing protein 21A
MVATLGSGESGGSVYIMDMSGAIDFPTVSLNADGRLERVASFDRTVWTADCNSDGTQVVLGELAEIGLLCRALRWITVTMMQSET